MLSRRALLIKRLAFGSVDESFENDGAILNSGESAGRDRQIVADDIEFRELGLFREVGLPGVGHADFVSLDREQLGVFFLAHNLRLHRLWRTPQRAAPAFVPA